MVSAQIVIAGISGGRDGATRRIDWLCGAFWTFADWWEAEGTGRVVGCVYPGVHFSPIVLWRLGVNELLCAIVVC